MQPSASPAAKRSDAMGARQSRMAQSFSQVVGVLMRDPNYRKMHLAELEWLVLPPVMAGQFRLGQASVPSKGTTEQQGAIRVPIAVALWARVSSEIDAALSANLDRQIRLPADQWVTGDNIWLIAVAGEQRSLPAFMEQIAKSMFKSKTVKLRAVGQDNKIVVKTLGEAIKH